MSREVEKVDYKRNDSVRSTGVLIMNADDWGRDRNTTDQTLDCVRCRSVSSLSAMVYMEDSSRAAALAREHEIDTGLHLNLTTPFSGGSCPTKLRECQEKIAGYLMRHRLAQAVFHPGLTNEFEYVVKAQFEEFNRLYGSVPSRLDGHHHMHLCANVLFQGLLPRGTIVRRNFSFEAGEKSAWNRLYRHSVDWILARRHRLTNYFFSLAPIQPESRLERILSLACAHIVEVETHPLDPDEYRFLTGGGIARLTGIAGMMSPEPLTPK